MAHESLPVSMYWSGRSSKPKPPSWNHSAGRSSLGEYDLVEHMKSLLYRMHLARLSRVCATRWSISLLYTPEGIVMYDVPVSISARHGAASWHSSIQKYSVSLVSS